MRVRPADELSISADAEIPPDLGRAGAVVEKAIDYMIEQNMASISIASALLGGALGLLARTLGDEAIVQILHNAIRGVRAGELQRAEALPAEPNIVALGSTSRN